MAGRPKKSDASEHEIERRLLEGMTDVEIAADLRVGVRTIARRIAEARKAHGQSWGKPTIVERQRRAAVTGTIIPTPDDDPAPGLSEEATPDELRRRARWALGVAMGMVGIETTAAVAAAAKVLALYPEPPEPPPLADRADVLARVREAIASAGPAPARPGADLVRVK